MPATTTICDAADSGDLCEKTASDDGTKVVDQYTEGGELLGAEPTVALALVVARGLAADARR